MYGIAVTFLSFRHDENGEEGALTRLLNCKEEQVSQELDQLSLVAIEQSVWFRRQAG